MSVLKRSGRLGTRNTQTKSLARGTYELKELFFSIKSKVPDLVSAALGNLKERIQIASFPSAEVKKDTGHGGSRSGQSDQSVETSADVPALSKSEIYGYNETLTPTFKLNLRLCAQKGDVHSNKFESAFWPRILLLHSDRI